MEYTKFQNVSCNFVTGYVRQSHQCIIPDYIKLIIHKILQVHIIIPITRKIFSIKTLSTPFDIRIKPNTIRSWCSLIILKNEVKHMRVRTNMK